MSVALVVVGIAFVVYGIQIMTIWSGTWFFAVWIALGAMLLGGAWALHAGWWAACPAVARRLVYGIVCVALAICAITQGAALSGFGARGEDDLDYIIVLGAQVNRNGPSVVLRQRLDTALDYLNANPRTRCIVSGGQGLNEPQPEAHAMARYLEERGINAGRIAVEDQSLNTVGNITNCLALIDPQNDRVGIVTSNFHVFRGVAIARKLGIAHVVGIAAPTTPWVLPNNLLRETFGIAKDFLQGNMKCW